MELLPVEGGVEGVVEGAVVASPFSVGGLASLGEKESTLFLQKKPC